MQVLAILYEIVAMITNLVVFLLIIQMVIGLLFGFNVINSSNQFLMTFYDSINRLLDPVLRPIRNVMPNTGAMDFSPLVLIVLLNIVLIVLKGVAFA